MRITNQALLQKDYYNGQTEKRNKLFFNNLYSVKKIRHYLNKILKPRIILDLGCGDGELIGDYSKKHRVYGIDLAPKLLSLARKKGLKTKRADLEKKIPFPDSFFDIVVMHHVLEHIADSDKLLYEVNRVLKPGGLIFLTVPNVASIFSLAHLLFDLPPYQGANYRTHHFRDFTSKTAKTALLNNGFIIEENYGGPFLVWNKYLNYLSFITRLIPQFAIDITILAHKKSSGQ